MLFLTVPGVDETNLLISPQIGQELYEDHRIQRCERSLVR